MNPVRSAPAPCAVRLPWPRPIAACSPPRPGRARLRIKAVFELREFELLGFELLRRRLGVRAFLLKALVTLTERLLHRRDPALSLREFARLLIQGSGFHLEVRLGLLESEGPRSSFLLEVGLLCRQIRFDLLQRLRVFREFNGLVRRLFAEGSLPRLDFEEALFGLVRNAFCVRFRLGSRPPGLFDSLLPALEVLVASGDPVHVGPDFLFLFLHVDLSRLDPHHPIRPRGPRGGSLLLERVPLVLQEGLLGLQRRLPGPSFLGGLRLLVSQASSLPP